MVTLLSSPFFVEYVLPFVLIFTVVFAILQKSFILGKDKKQIDAIVALVIALIVISFANAIGIINSLLPFLAVTIVIILVFLLLIAMLHLKSGEFELNPTIKNIMMGLIAIAVVIAVMVATGAWDFVMGRWFSGSAESLGNFVFIIIVLAAVAFVVWPKKKDD